MSTPVFFNQFKLKQNNGAPVDLDTDAIKVTCALASNIVQWAHNDITWLQSVASGFANGRTFIWYQDTGVDATSKLIMYMQEAADFGNVNGDLILDGSAVTGVANFT
jgi:hypothetical protein